VADLRAAALVIEDLAGGGVAVACRQANVPTTHVAELGGAGPYKGALELGQFLVIGDVEV
jgi:hypothetical protein